MSQFHDLRDFEDEEGGSCDWGNCDHPGVAMRWSHNHGWLPVCVLHLGVYGIGSKWGEPLFPASLQKGDGPA